jgi:hypothetical protein
LEVWDGLAILIDDATGNAAGADEDEADIRQPLTCDG